MEVEQILGCPLVGTPFLGQLGARQDSGQEQDFFAGAGGPATILRGAQGLLCFATFLLPGFCFWRSLDAT